MERSTDERAHIRQFTLSLRPDEGLVHPVDDALAAAPALDRQSLRHVQSNPETSTLCYRIEGDERRLPAVLDERSDVLLDDVIHDDGGAFGLYLRVEGELAVFERCFFEQGVLVDPPIAITGRGLRLQVIGTPAMIKRAMERLPSGVACSVDRLGGAESDGLLVAALTDRQREVIETAFDLGYYEIPRRTTHADIATVLDLSGSTIDEHLRKAEAKLMEQLLS